MRLMLIDSLTPEEKTQAVRQHEQRLRSSHTSCRLCGWRTRGARFCSDQCRVAYADGLPRLSVSFQWSTAVSAYFAKVPEPWGHGDIEEMAVAYGPTPRAAWQRAVQLAIANYRGIGALPPS